ncbi:hypothetical protein [Escherichia coli]|uniref:hypothetical protein n=1 Tax=Escherichia coli TaxID=562 RepID=UPI00098BE3F5|nr:hypothetical protein [Escherichia coli]
MAIHNRAGQPAQQSDLINVAQLTAQYYVLKPEAGNAEHAVKFGTSGHRGSAARHSFNEPHILAIAQAIAEERAKNGITGPCYVGKVVPKLSPEMVSASTLAGDPITARLTAAPGNGASIGGLKVMTDNGWFAARPSGTEDAYKIYCESFLGEEHRKQIEKEAVEIVSEVLKNA